MNEQDLITYPIWQRYSVVSNFVTKMSIKDRRLIFQLSRHFNATADTFFPTFGITFSEFAVWYVLGENKRKGRKIG